MMKNAYLDARRLCDSATAYPYLERKLGMTLPAYNLDALHDVLTESRGAALTVHHARAWQQSAAFAARLRRMVTETCAQTPGLTLREKKWY